MANSARFGLSLVQQGIVHDFVVIDDASTDRTAELAKQAGAGVITLAKRTGKGGAVLEGVHYCKNNDADVLLTVDADLVAAPAKLVISMLDHLRSNNGAGKLYSMVIAPYSGVIGSDAFHRYSGQRAIRMSSMNFLFAKQPEGFVLSDSATAQRFIAMSQGYGLELALNWQVNPCLMLEKNNGTFEFKDIIRRDNKQTFGLDLDRVGTMIAGRTSKLNELLSARNGGAAEKPVPAPRSIPPAPLVLRKTHR